MQTIGTLFLLLALLAGRISGQQRWLTDEESRTVAEALVHDTHPEDCYSTYRKEALEQWVVAVRQDTLAGNEVNRSVYIYEVAADSCYYVSYKNERPELLAQVYMHEAGYGIVAVDRQTKKGYWFG